MPDDDPRITPFLLECLEKARWAGPTAKPVWELIFKKLASLNDVRALPALRQAAKNLPPILGAAHASWLKQALADTTTHIERSNRGVIATKPIVAKAKPASPLALVAAVFERPHDEATKHVVADALMEAGDPWGELIAMQLDAKRKPKDAAPLIQKNLERIAGPIAHIGPRKRFVVEKGFLVQCEVGGPHPRPRWEEAVAAPHWATVRVLILSLETPGWWLTELARQANCKSLERIDLSGLWLVRAPGAPVFMVTEQKRPLAQVPAKSRMVNRLALKWLAQYAAGLPVEVRKKMAGESLNAQVRAVLED